MNRHLTACVVIVVLLYCGLALALDPPPAYLKHCAACHAADGSGRESSAIGKIPDLRSKNIVSLSDDQLFNAIARGDVHKSYAHSFLNQGVSDPELRGIARYVRAIQGRPLNAVSGKTNSSR
ncbi:MAG TPA: cytochrome c [Candidatus Sulfotelmatobacter sp.]|nr:cytochrome c [Candidatus Sulfotelmatobacter sp.]